MFMSFMTEFLDVGFTNMKKKVLHDKYISVDALFESRSYERSLNIFFLFYYILRERLEPESGSSFSYVSDCVSKSFTSFSCFR